MGKAIPVLDRLKKKSSEAPCLIKGLLPLCWIYGGYLNDAGYGMIGIPGGKVVRAHRVAYEELVAAISGGLELDHLCRNRACWNPWHTEPVTHAENIRRGHGGLHHARKTHCPQGHPYDAENTYQPPGKTHRNCLACYRKHQAKRWGKTQVAINKKAGLCYRGHSLEDADVSGGVRRCRTCRLERYARNKKKIETETV